MKQIILSVAAVLAFGFANAQDKESYVLAKGDMWVEGAFKISSFNNSQSADAKTNDYSFTPKVGWMHNDKFGWGGFLDLAGAKFVDNHKSQTYGIGAFVRWYGLSLGDRKSFNAYTELGLGYTNQKDEPTIGESNTVSTMNAHLDLGTNYFITKNWAVVFIVSNILAYNSSSPTNGSNTSDISVNINLFNNPFAQSQFGLLYRW